MIKKIGMGLITLAILLSILYFVFLRYLEQKNNQEVLYYINNTSIKKLINETEEVKKEKESQYESKSNYTAILEIPKINLKRGVVNSNQNFSSINYAISVDNHSNYPNQKGNFIVFAHSGNSQIGYFKRLIDIDINDDIYIYFEGIKYHYKIFKIYNIEKIGKAKVLSTIKSNYITLITCNQKQDGYQIVLIGELIDQVDY